MFKLVEYDDTLVFQNPVEYRTQFIKMDTKMYGLPQTRNRGYLFVWQPDLITPPAGQDIGELWKELCLHLEASLCSSHPNRLNHNSL